MTATIIKFPRRANRDAIRVAHVEGEWTVIYGSQGWSFASRAGALQEALTIAEQVDVNIIIIETPYSYGGRAPC
jgi:hypothetical protein